MNGTKVLDFPVNANQGLDKLTGLYIRFGKLHQVPLSPIPPAPAKGFQVRLIRER